MKSLKVTTEFGILVRRAALQQRSVSLDDLLKSMDSSPPLDINDDLISFGPSFGSEAVHVFISRLEKLGLVYSDDFFDLKMDHPDWCIFQASLR